MVWYGWYFLENKTCSQVHFYFVIFFKPRSAIYYYGLFGTKLELSKGLGTAAVTLLSNRELKNTDVSQLILLVGDVKKEENQP